MVFGVNDIYWYCIYIIFFSFFFRENNHFISFFKHSCTGTQFESKYLGIPIAVDQRLKITKLLIKNRFYKMSASKVVASKFAEFSADAGDSIRLSGQGLSV